MGFTRTSFSKFLTSNIQSWLMIIGWAVGEWVVVQPRCTILSNPHLRAKGSLEVWSEQFWCSFHFDAQVKDNLKWNNHLHFNSYRSNVYVSSIHQAYANQKCSSELCILRHLLISKIGTTALQTEDDIPSHKQRVLMNFTWVIASAL
jgi:hypothetical protein